VIGLATFLARLFPALAQWFMFTFAAWHIAALAAVVAIVVLFLDKLLLLLAWVGGLLLEGVVWVLAGVLIYLVGMLPSVPDNFPTMAWGAIVSTLAAANRYLPLDIMFQYMGIIFSVYASLMIWKLVKFVRGSG
jgi:hypothetical protein